VHALKHSALATALILAFVAKNPSYTALRKRNRDRRSWSCDNRRGNNYAGYQNASLYKIDHPCRVSLPATVSDRGWSYARLGFLS